MRSLRKLLLLVLLAYGVCLANVYALPVSVSTGDLGTNVIANAGLFEVFLNAESPSAGAASALNVKYGLFNSPDVLVSVFLNDLLLGDFLADRGYLSPGPEFANFDVTGQVVGGLNKITFNGFGANAGDYVIGQVTLNYEQVVNPDGPAPVPEPATMLLLGTGLAGLVGVGRRKLKKA